MFLFRCLLFCAIHGGDRHEYVNVLLTSGVDLNKFNSDLQLYPLLLACHLKDLSAVGILLRHGADPNAVLPKNGR